MDASVGGIGYRDQPVREARASARHPCGDGGFATGAVRRPAGRVQRVRRVPHAARGAGADVEHDDPVRPGDTKEQLLADHRDARHAGRQARIARADARERHERAGARIEHAQPNARCIEKEYPAVWQPRRVTRQR
jgi:hypothetical protein